MKFGTGKKKTLRLSLGRFPGKRRKGGMTDLSSAEVEGDYIPSIPSWMISVSAVIKSLA